MKSVRVRFVQGFNLSPFLFGVCARRLMITFQRTLGNVLLSGALVTVMEPHYLSQMVLLSE